MASKKQRSFINHGGKRVFIPTENVTAIEEVNSTTTKIYTAIAAFTIMLSYDDVAAQLALNVETVAEANEAG